MTLDKTLKQRGGIYGDYEHNSIFRADLLSLSRISQYTPTLIVIYVTDLVSKIARIAACPRHLDSWHDLAGYSLLITQQEFPKVPKATPPKMTYKIFESIFLGLCDEIYFNRTNFEYRPDDKANLKTLAKALWFVVMSPNQKAPYKKLFKLAQKTEWFLKASGKYQ